MSTTPTYHTATDRRTQSSAVERAIIAALQERGVPVVPGVKLGNNWVFDGAINGTRVLLEIHGDYWHTRPEVQARDARKQEWAARNGYQIVVIWEAEYHADAEAQLRRVHEAVLAGGIAPAKADKSDAPPPRRRDYGDWREAFLAALAGGARGLIGEACAMALVSRDTIARHRRDDPDFDAAIKHIRQNAADALRKVYHQRALEQSDRAMEYMIRHLDPEADGAGGAGVVALLLPYLDLSRLTDEQLDRLAAGEDPRAVILAPSRGAA